MRAECKLLLDRASFDGSEHAWTDFLIDTCPRAFGKTQDPAL